jgi:putative SOS response-associated peptidase YedK
MKAAKIEPLAPTERTTFSMCYSVLVETDLKKLAHHYGAEIDDEAFASIYRSRSSGTENLYIPRAIEANFFGQSGPAAAAIQELSQEYNKKQIEALTEKLAEKENLIADLENKISKKWFKTTQQKLDTAKRVSSRTKSRIERLTSPIDFESPEDSRVVQYSYAPLIVRDGGHYLIRPYRYQVRGRDAKVEPNRKINMFNARIETIQERSTWKPLFMSNHGILPYKGFYEWVEHPKTKITSEIYFFPTNHERLWAPALFEKWQDGAEAIESFAIITSDPPPEVESMGHDRCPVFPRQEFQKEWLNPESCNAAYILKQLQNKEVVTYDHYWPERL